MKRLEGFALAVACLLLMAAAGQDLFPVYSAVELDGPNPLVLNSDLTSANTRRLAPGPPETWQYISGAGTWSGVSPPTTIATRTSEISSTTNFGSVALTGNAAVPAATSDVLIGGRIMLGGGADSCRLTLRRDEQPSPDPVLVLWDVGGSGTDLSSNHGIDYQYVDVDPGAGATSYFIQISRPTGTGTCTMSPGNSYSYMVMQVYQ